MQTIPGAQLGHDLGDMPLTSAQRQPDPPGDHLVLLTLDQQADDLRPDVVADRQHRRAPVRERQRRDPEPLELLGETPDQIRLPQQHHAVRAGADRHDRHRTVEDQQSGRARRRAANLGAQCGQLPGSRRGRRAVPVSVPVQHSQPHPALRQFLGYQTRPRLARFADQRLLGAAGGQAGDRPAHLVSPLHQFDRVFRCPARQSGPVRRHQVVERQPRLVGLGPQLGDRLFDRPQQQIPGDLRRHRGQSAAVPTRAQQPRGDQPFHGRADIPESLAGLRAEGVAEFGAVDVGAGGYVGVRPHRRLAELFPAEIAQVRALPVVPRCPH
ncbi:hypothetical protein Aca07nite_68950 [Actinoplanes capillaceus]|uniref:Uncharacterized protein n=1 Tax=Actinoplanes campanulatus TaxID=113559 RepID=A0ABQ3WTY4_9ACTN|nr:hypothetical protein Aca07nite_68950 [Actinoplanes capillaceus]